MKTAIKNTDLVLDLEALKNLTLTQENVKYVSSENRCYYFFPNSTSGDVKPNIGNGYWHVDLFANLFYEVEDTYDFITNEATEIIDERIKYLSQKHSSLKYEIQNDVDGYILFKDIRSINYKTELKSNISYTPIYKIHDSGVYSGLLDKTEYYRGYVDANNKGTLVLVVEEQYELDTTDITLNNSGNPVISRVKKWKYTKEGGVEFDEENIKVKTKVYDTRRKKHDEGQRRRDNILEQLIDNVGLAGVLSGIFISSADAHDKLTNLLATHSSSFNAWMSSSRGPLYDDVLNDTTNTWLSSVVSNALNQPSLQRTAIAPIELTSVQHMMDMSLRSYIIEKIKGNIK